MRYRNSVLKTKMLRIFGLAYKKMLKNSFGKTAFLPYGNSNVLPRIHFGYYAFKTSET